MFTREFEGKAGWEGPITLKGEANTNECLSLLADCQSDEINSINHETIQHCLTCLYSLKQKQGIQGLSQDTDIFATRRNSQNAVILRKKSHR